MRRRSLGPLLCFAFPALPLAACGDNPLPAATTTAAAGPGAGGGGSGGMGGSGGIGGSGGGQVDILAELQQIEGLTVIEETSVLLGYRYFTMEFDQPADHQDPGGQRFSQRMTLLHRATDAPFVLESTGYFIYTSFQILGEPAEMLGGNQLFVEHRFFTPSRPEPATWSHLTIEQAAADHHRIIEALRPHYSGKWISTGISKGGATSIYHRRFYPDDVDATVAYVSPLSFGDADPRYLEFLEQVGDADCRSKLQALQIDALSRRDAMLLAMADQASTQGLTYDFLGVDRAFEYSVIELPFAFWEHNDVSRCADIPDATASDDQVWEFLDQIDAPSYWSDESLLVFEPYFWQSATQRGYPAIAEEHLAPQLLFPGTNLAATFVVPGPGKDAVLDPGSMVDIASWVTTQGERLMFIYGEYDPWSAAAFELGDAKDSYRYYAAGGNHGSGIVNLAPADQGEALGALEAWTGVTPILPPAPLPGAPLPARQQVMRKLRW